MEDDETALADAQAQNPAATLEDLIAFEAGNIIIGGAGSDKITGNGGDDILDGDRWLNVRISIKTSADTPVRRSRLSTA